MAHPSAHPTARAAIRPLLVLFVSLGAALGAPGCSPPPTVVIEAKRTSPHGGDRVLVGATSAQRFGGMGVSQNASAHGESEVPLEWDVPEGWGELPSSGMRLANLQPAGNPEAECTLIILQGSGGGLAANLNRWANQMGLEDLDQAAIDALPRRNLLGMPATEIRLDGAYSGMGDTAQEGFALLGLVLPSEAFTIFVKLTGPAALVDAESEAFRAFCASIRPKPTGHYEGDGHDHGSEAAADAGSTPSGGHGEGGEALVSSGTEGRAAARYEVPTGWRDLGPRSLRIVNLQASEETQCYVIELVGEAGGELANLNRWAGEVGAAHLDEAGVAALERVELLGASCPLIEVSGEYSGMGGGEGAGRTVLGTLLIRSTSSVFVKMVGPSEEVAANRDAFIEFCASLEVEE